MTERHTLTAFLAVVAAIVALAILAAVKGTQTDLAIMTGLIGVLGTFKPQPRKVEIDNPPSDPVPVETTK